MPAVTIPEKSATSTEVIRVPTRAVIDGVSVDPTGYAVSAAVVDQADFDAGRKYVPVPADYVTQSWEDDGDRYWASILLGPLATLNPAGPVAPNTRRVYNLWVRIVAGSENVCRRVGQISLTP